jgi:hypothetical protein
MRLRDTSNWLAFAAAAIVAGNFAQLLISPTYFGVVALALAILLAWLLVRRDRIAWMITCLSAGGQLAILAVHGKFGLAAATDCIVLICLLAPPALRSVWRDQPKLASSSDGGGAETSDSFAENIIYARLIRIADWSINALGGSASEAAWRLGAAAILFLVPVTFTYNWGNRSHSELASIIANVMWICWALTVVAFVSALLLILASHYTSANRSSSVQKRK